MAEVLPQAYHRSRAHIEEIVRELHEMSVQIGHEEMIEVLGEVRNRLGDPFMFVVVGEVKSGKSRFVNALLESEEEICKVAPDPMTDTIQQIVYGEEAETQTINPYLKRIYRPIPILKEIAVVDTPGTNTIIEHHQEITERFIPSSDLIVFVFEAKNPYRQSAWDFFDLIQDEWRKKLIFILQQKDLMDEEELKVNRKGLENLAVKKGMDDPRIFAVSASLEQEGKREESGFVPLRKYIKENITGGKAPFLKLESSLNTAENFAVKIRSGVTLRRRQLEADREFREDIQETLEKQEQRSRNQVGMLIENLIGGYDKIAVEKRDKLAHGLSFFPLLGRSIRSIFTKEASIKSWLNQLARNIEEDMQNTLTRRLSTSVDDLAEQIKTMVRLIDLKIKSSETILKNDHELFSDIAEQRENVLQDLQKTFTAFLEKQENFKDERLFPSVKEMSPQVAAGSGMAVIGIVLATVTQGMVLDITGGVITAIGLVFAGITVGLNKGKVLRNYDKEIKAGRERMQTVLHDKLTAYILHLKSRIEQHFDRFDRHLEKEQQQVEALEERLSTVEQGIVEEKDAVGRQLTVDSRQ